MGKRGKKMGVLDKTTTIIKEQLPKKGISIYEGTKILLKI